MRPSETKRYNAQQKLKGIVDGESNDPPHTPLDTILHQGPCCIPCTRGLCSKHHNTNFAGCCHRAPTGRGTT
jgi:hypothetical protein